MCDLRVVAVAVGLSLSAHGCASSRQGVPPAPPPSISHHEIGADVFREIRVAVDRDVFLRITDANTLVYDYSLTSRDVVIDEAARAALRALLASPPASEDKSLFPFRAAVDAGKVAAFEAFAESVFSSSRQLAAFVRYSDQTRSASDVRDRRDSTLERLPVANYLTRDGELAARADALWNAVPDANKPALRDRHAALVAAIPGIDTLAKAIRRATFGELWIHRDTNSSDAAMVELQISSKLGRDYPGVRWTGKGKDIALVRAAFPRIAWTAGMAGVFRSDRAFQLQPVAGDAGKFRVTGSSDSRLALVPLGMLTVQRPCCAGSTIGGVSLGAGLRGGAPGQLDDATDLFLMATLGLDWLRVSLGGAYTAEIHELAGVQEGEIVDSPNALNAQRTKRRLRPAVALHMNF